MLKRFLLFLIFLSILNIAAIPIDKEIIKYKYIGYGWASQYDKGVMERVIRYRQRYNQIPYNLDRYDGFIAVQNAEDIGKEFIIIYGNNEYLVLAVDCASKSDQQSNIDLCSGYQWMNANNILVEVNYELAEQLGSVRRGFKISLLEVLTR